MRMNYEIVKRRVLKAVGVYSESERKMARHTQSRNYLFQAVHRPHNIIDSMQRNRVHNVTTDLQTVAALVTGTVVKPKCHGSLEFLYQPPYTEDIDAHRISMHRA